MSKIKILSVVGARPQFMKSAALSKTLSKYNKFEEILVHTGQHYDTNMSASLINELFERKIDFLLDAGGKNEIEMMAYIACELQKIFLTTMPKIIIVYGDTTTTLAAALTARKMNIPLVHIESGVRNYDNSMPEEVNRILVDRISELNICVTSKGKDNLYREGFKSLESKVVVCGDLMYETYLNKMKELNNQKSKLLKDHNLVSDNYIFCTIHRASNVDDISNLKNIIKAINEINKVIPVVFSIHPRTRKKIREKKLNLYCVTCEPVSYSESLLLLKDCKFAVTDSGGIIRESYFARKKSLLILESPLWPEINFEHCSINCPPKKESIIEGFNSLENLSSNFESSIFGEGNTSFQIHDLLEEMVLEKKIS